MLKAHYVFFIAGKRYAGPFMTFQSAFSHAIRYQTDFRIENSENQILATWSLWTGLYKVDAKYHYLVTDCEFNRSSRPDLIGQVLEEMPQGLMVQDVEAA